MTFDFICRTLYTMKTILRITFILLIALPFLLLNEQAQSNPSGGPAGHANDPAGNNKTCRSCHSGAAPTEINAISTNVPTEGYTPGQTYAITVSITEAGKVRFGFQASVQNASGTPAGSIALINSTETQLVGSNLYVTHRTAGNSGQGAKSWQFNWTAPSAGFGPATVYASVMAANNANGSSGDNVYRSALTIQENTTIGVSSPESEVVSVFPNPVSDFIRLQTALNSPAQIFIYSLTGQMVYSGQYASTTSDIDVSSLKSGIYLLVYDANNQRSVKRFVKN